MAQDLVGGHLVKGHGPGPLIAAVKFAPSNVDTAQTLTENWGVSQVIRATGGQAGRWTVTLSSLSGKYQELIVIASFVENDTTLFHFVDVDSISASAGTFIVRHRSVAFASIASGPTLSDTVDFIQIFVYGRSAL